MRTVRDVMVSSPTSLVPTDTVHAAVLLARTRNATVLPVLREGQVIGLVSAALLFMFQPDVMVGEIMRQPVSIGVDESLCAASRIMQDCGLQELPVHDGEFVGMLRSIDMLSMWAMPVDPNTGLPWQDSFRLRSAMQLASGNELTVLFFDMDRFGSLNKLHGHVVADGALKAVAGILKELMDPALDTACRFGGDEFVVSTTRSRPDAVAWAAHVREAFRNLHIEGISEVLNVSVGVAGGLRQGEREGVHPASNLDDLINRASKASTLAKDDPQGMTSLDPVPLSATADTRGDAPSKVRVERVRLRTVETDVEGTVLSARVTLERAGRIESGVSEGSVGQEAAVVAEAAARAVARFLSGQNYIQMTSALEASASENERVIVATVRLDGPLGRQNLLGVAGGFDDIGRIAAKAVLDAVNRPLEALADAQPAETDVRFKAVVN